MTNPLTIGLDDLSRLAKEAGAEADAKARAVGITPAAKSVFGTVSPGSAKRAAKKGWATGTVTQAVTTALGVATAAYVVTKATSHRRDDDEQERRKAPDSRSAG